MKAIKNLKTSQKAFKRRLYRQSHDQWTEQGYPRRINGGKLGHRRRLKLIQKELDTGVSFGIGDKYDRYQKRLQIYREMYPHLYRTTSK